MNEQLTKVIRILWVEYSLFILIPLLICLSFEAGWLTEGRYATDARMQYVVETVGVLLAMVLVPLSLKLFSMVMKRVKDKPLLDAIKQYRVWSSVRLLLLVPVVVPNVLIYYSTLNNMGGFCALIGVTASLFCLPGVAKMKNELDISNNLEE